jgi:ATP-binding cassette subfamily B protein
LVVLDRGQVVEEGHHEELIARKGAYFRLDRAQTEFLNGGPVASDDDDAPSTLTTLKEI